ncbi:NUDIX domain-containing protein [Marine Group I thaumarchaeote]|jgi:8-oxo-dGTP pyrophosphatase MutT (NUDIX family)|uniref:NUDIX domain-containing protein n=1 Tax=Marine Group I thaumarchaeote TaxID=2511932 RepID=A0A7K4MTQ8_9ARCH|nr:MAG: NUDIX domain-containing protein [Nitrosopumilus sp. YT1]NMI81614.1 NUDIX domain-containing protein [Candidatus Nitrosopumilus sp. MTA1]NWJ19549.1 NUDIX domain-containing protein [Marine Group I thaumarchaeote]NWJ28450.1 NUDIX domain-containing protein [Marine Group I thaumarchaeote]NWJ56882.1 NUDIX domain-containing protein [Marine Group I thaumarchaeote]
MRSTKIVTSFIKDNEKLLILKRSDKVKSMKGLWAGISGIIEKNEEPLKRAKIEILEEVGIIEDKITLVRSVEEMRINSPQYENHEWEIFPFLFEAKNPIIKLNWENSEFKWINKEELENYDTVPSLQKVLFNLL